MSTASVMRAHDVADTLFERNAAVFGGDLQTYKGHVHRVIGTVGLQCDVPATVAGPSAWPRFSTMRASGSTVGTRLMHSGCWPTCSTPADMCRFRSVLSITDRVRL